MKIGLIAMSGVRACDPELLTLGLTLPGFIERSKTIASLPSLGLLTLAGLTPDRHEVDYVEVERLDDPGVDTRLVRGWDLVAISTFTAQAPEAYRLADRLRGAGVRVVIGGLHATAVPDEAARHADAVVVGEGEPVWVDLLEDAENNALRPRYEARREGRDWDLADAPMPRFDLLDLDRYNRITVQTTRGCPWRCEFCASSILLTDAYKHKPIDRVLAEVDAIAQRWPRPFLELADDNSFVNLGYWRKLLPELAKRDLRWFTETDIRVGADDELLQMMREAGCVQVLIGLEAVEPAALQGLERRADFKHRYQPRYAELIGNIQRHGIRVNGCFILGLDSHGPDVFERVERAAEALQLFDVQVTLQTPFPGTPLYRRLAEAGRLLYPTDWERYTLFDVTHRPAGMDVEELAAGFRGLVSRLYDEPATTRRRAQFRHLVGADAG